jgi:NADH-quinone oxidoreductase subunit B
MSDATPAVPEYVPNGNDARIPIVVEEQHEGILVTVLSKLVNWGRSNSLWPFGFGLACCAIEFISTAATPQYDISRFGSEVTRASPRQCDLIIVPGTVTKKMAPRIKNLWDQMPDPKYAIAMGACAINGGPYQESYFVVKGVDKIIPVDVYIPGCPPRPEALLDGLQKLQAKIRDTNESLELGF